MLREAIGLDQLDTRLATAVNREQIEEIHNQMEETVAMIAPGVTIEDVLAQMPNSGSKHSSKHEFVDRERSAMNESYDLMSSPKNLTTAQVANGLKKLITRDPTFSICILPSARCTTTWVATPELKFC